MFKDKVIMITGATRGIGRAAALALIQEGAHILAVGRTNSALESLDDEASSLPGKITLVQLDLSQIDNISNFAHSVVDRFGRLDGLFGNAGALGTIGPTSHLELKEWVEIFNINVMANLALVKHFDSILQQSQARVVFVTSGAARKLRPFWSSYATSKLALEAMVTIYARENENKGLRVNLFDPGIVRTSMRAQAFPGEDASKLPAPESLTPTILKMLSVDFMQNGKIIGPDGNVI